jgi:hypothetical protein
VNPTCLGVVKIYAVIDHRLRQGNAIAEMLVEKNQRSQSGKGTAVVDFETAGEKQRRITPIGCRAAGVPYRSRSGAAYSHSEGRAEAIGGSLHSIVRRGLSQQGAGLIRNASPTPILEL